MSEDLIERLQNALETERGHRVADRLEARAEIERLTAILDVLTDGAQWCGVVDDVVAANVNVWTLPRCDGRTGGLREVATWEAVKAAEKGGSDE